MPERSPLATAILCALGYVGVAPSAGANDLDLKTDSAGNKYTTTSFTNEADGSTSIRTQTTSGNVGFNSFENFRVNGGNTVNLHHAANTEHLVNLVHDSRIEIDGTVNSLINNEVGGHLVFADPYGMLVGAGGRINAGRLTLTTPTSAFMDSVVDGGAFGNTAATDALVNGTLSADDIESDAVIEINGDINTTGGVHIHAGGVQVGTGAAVESGTEDALTNIASAVNVSGIATGTAATVTDGSIRIVAETAESIGDGRTSDPLESTTTPPMDSEFAVAVNGRLAVARSDTGAAPEDTRIDVTGKDVRVGDAAELDAQGSATFHADGTLDNAGTHVGGEVKITAEREPLDDPATELWNPASPLYRGSNVDLGGDIDGFRVDVDGRYIDVDDGATLSAAQRSTADHEDGSVSLTAISEQYQMWGIAEADAGIRVNGTLEGQNLDLSAYAAAVSGQSPYEDEVTLPGETVLTASQETLHQQVSGLKEAESFGLAMVADADATIEIGDTADLTAVDDLNVASGALRNASTDRLFSSFFTGVSMVHGELLGETRVHVADGARLKAGGDVRLNALSDNDLGIKAVVVNLLSAATGVPVNKFALSYAYGNVETDTTVTVDHGAWLGDPTDADNDGVMDDAIGGLDMRAETFNNVAVTAKSYSLAGTGLSTAVALHFTDEQTHAKLHADVATTGDVNVAARSFTEYSSAFTDAEVGLNPLAMSQIFAESVVQYATDPHGTFEGDLASVASLNLDEGLAIAGGALISGFLDYFRVGVGASLAYSDIDHQASAVIGAADATSATDAPTITADGDVTVYAERVMTDVRHAGGSAVQAGLLADRASKALAIGVVYTDIANEADAIIGAGTTIDANRVGVKSVSDLPLEITFTDSDNVNSPKDFVETYFNICAGLCSDITTTYTASGASASGMSLTGNANVWLHDNDATTTIGDGATITARATGSNSDWMTTLPGLPSGPGGLAINEVTLWWRDEIDLGSYARIEEVHVSGLFSVIGTFIGTALGNGANPVGGSLNYIQDDNNARTIVGENVELTAEQGAVGVRARSDEFVMAVSPSANASAGSASFAGGLTGGVVDLKTTTEATVAASASLKAKDVTVAADHRVNAWVITGALMSSSATATVAVSLAGLLVDSEVTARIGDPAADGDGNETPVSRPADSADYTVEADRVDVRARSYGDVGAFGIQTKIPGSPGPAFGPLPKSAVSSTATNITQKLGLSVTRGPLSPLKAFKGSPERVGTTAGGYFGFAGSLVGAASFSVLDDNTTAELRNVRVGGLTDPTVDDVSVVARREIEHLNVAGGAGIGFVTPTTATFTSVNVTTTLALSLNEGATQALLEGVRIDATDRLDVIASRADGNFVAGLGAAATFGTGFTVDGVASVSLHLDDATTRASVDRSYVGAVTNDVRVLALDQSQAFVGAGAGTFGVNGSGLGLTLGYAQSDRTIEALVSDSELLGVGGDVRVQAKRATRTVAVGASIGGSHALGLSVGTASSVALDDVTAAVTGSTVGVDGLLAVETRMDTDGIDFSRGELGLMGRGWTPRRDTLNADDDPEFGLDPFNDPNFDRSAFDAEAGLPDADPAGYFDLDAVPLDDTIRDALPDANSSFDLSIAGGIAYGGKVGVGGAVAFNSIDNTITAGIADTTINDTPSGVRVRALDGADATAVSIGAAISGGPAGIGAALAGNQAKNTLTAELDNVTLSQSAASIASWADTGVTVETEDRSDLKSVALQAAVGDKFALAPALAVNHVETTRTARIGAGDLEAADVTVRAEAFGVADAKSVGIAATTAVDILPGFGAYAGAWFSGAASFSINVLRDAVTAEIHDGATVEARDSVVVEAAAEQRVKAGAGAVALALQGPALGGNAPINVVETDVNARIGDVVPAGTTVTAHGHGTQSMRTGELVSGAEPQRFETFDEVRSPTLEAAYGDVRGVAVGANSLQSTASLGGSVAANLASVGLGLGVTTNVTGGRTDAVIRNADINPGAVAGNAAHAAQAVTVRASSQIWSADAAFVAAGSGTTSGVGGSVVLSGISRSTHATVDDADIEARGALNVESKTRAGTSLLALGLGGGATGGGAAQVGFIKHKATTVATVRNSSLTVGELNIDADARNGALIAVGSGGGGGTVGVGIGAGILHSGMRTEASLYGDNDDVIDTDGGDVSVTAHTDSKLKNIVVGVGVGGTVGAAASIVYTEFANRTDALLASHDDDNLGGAQRLTLGGANDRIGSLTVHASEQLDVSAGAGTLAGGIGAVGVGGAAAMVVGRSVTQTTVSDTDVYAQSIDLDTTRELHAQTWAVSVAGGFVGALAGGVSLIVLGDTSMGALAPELDAGSDGSVSLLDSLTSPGDVGMNESLISADSQSDMQAGLSGSPALGDTTADGTDGAFTRVTASTLDSATTIAVDATTRVGTKARAGAGAVAFNPFGSAAAGVGVARTALHNRTQVDITSGSVLNAGTDVHLSAAAGEFVDHPDFGDQKALDVLVGSGAAAVWASFAGSFAAGENRQFATVDVHDSRILARDADLAATTAQSADIKAYAGSGALLTGSATLAQLVLEPEAVVTLSGTTTDANGDPEPWQVASLDVDASNTIDYDHRAFGVSVGGASFAGAKGTAEITPVSRIDLADGLLVEVPTWQRVEAGGFDLSAYNVLAAFGDDRVAGAYSGGLFAGAFPVSDTTLDFTAAVNVGADVVLDARGGGMGSDGGDIRLDARNTAEVRERIDSVAVGAVAQSEDAVRIDLDATFAQSVTVADGAAVRAGRDLDLATDTNVDIEVRANANAGGIVGAANARGTLNLTLDNDIGVSGGATLAAFRDIALETASSSATTRADLEVQAYTYAVGGGAEAWATVDLDRLNDIDLGNDAATGGAIRAGRDVRIATGDDSVNAVEQWRTQKTALFVPIRDSGGAPDVTLTDTVRIDTPIEAGYLNRLFLTVAADDRFSVTDGAGNDVLPAFADWTGIDTQTVLTSFNPYDEIQARIDALGPNPDPNALAILERLRSQMPNQTVDAVQLGGFAVSAGDIVIDVDDANAASAITAGSNGSLTASGGPVIEIDNEGQRYLRITDDLAVLSGGGSGGTVSAGGLTLPGGLAVSERRANVAATDARIGVMNSATSGAPGLFVEGGLRNPLGTVRLLNVDGDLAQFGPIIARVIDIDVPKGTFAVDRSGGIYPGINAANLYATTGYSTPDDKDNVFANSFSRLWNTKKTKRIDWKVRWRKHRSSSSTEYHHESADRTTGWEVVGTSNTGPSAGESLLRAQWVGITADYIDINSDIVAGQNSAYSLNLDADVRAQIDAHNAGPDAGQDLELTVDGPFGTPIGATYSAADNRIVLDPVEVQSGPGGVYLNGKIYSTVADADITINNGIASIDIANSTGIAVELADISAGADGAAAVLKITDHFMKNFFGQARTTWYVNSSEFETQLGTRETRRYETYATYQHWETNAAGAIGALDALKDPGNIDLQRITSGIDQYQTRSGTLVKVYRRWHAGSNPARSGSGEPTWDDHDWLGSFSQTHDSAEIIHENSLGTPQAKSEWCSSFGCIQLSPANTAWHVDQNNVLVQRKLSMKTDIVYEVKTERSNHRHERVTDTWYNNARVEEATFEERVFARADYSFGVAFEGGDTASVEIDSNASVIVDGRISSPAGPLSICAGGACDVGTGGTAPLEAAGIYSGAGGAAELSALGMTLEADAGIGLADGNLATSGVGVRALTIDTVSGSALDAVARNGSIDLVGTGSGSLTLDRLHAVNGHVNIGGAGTLAQAASASGAVIRGQTIDLEAGTIGTAATPLGLEVTDAFGHVNAEAVTGIHLDAVAGDLPVGQIVTTGTGAGEGDITLAAAGQIKAAQGRETNFAAVVADNEQVWDDLALTEAGVAAAQERDVTTFEESVEGAYAWYWQIHNLAVDADGNLTLDAEAERHFQPFADTTGQTVEAYLTSELERLDDLFDTAFEGNRPSFLETFDPDFTLDYSAPDAVAEAVKIERRAWSLDELAAPLPGNAAQAATGSVLANTPQHIAATGDVTLSAGGDIGRVLPETTFTVDGEWVLPDDDARAAVLTAGAGDIACEVNGAACAVDADTGSYVFEAGNAYTFTIERRQALRVDAEGTLNATSGGNALIGDGDTVGGMTVGRIEAAGELRLLSAAAITSDSGLLVNAADGIWLTTAAGAIGTAVDPITIAAAGAVNDAVGSGGVYLAAGRDGVHGGTLTLGRVEATGGGTIGLSGGDATYMVERVGLSGANLTAATLELDYTGSFGTATTAPTLTNGINVAGTLDGSGHLLGEASLGLADLSVTGDLHVEAGEHIGVAGLLDVAGHADLISPTGTVELLATGGLQAGSLYADALHLTQAAGTSMTVTGLADLDLAGTLDWSGTFAAGDLDAFGGTLAQAETGHIDVDNTALLDFAGDIDLAGRVDADTLTSTSAGFNQAVGSVIATDTRAAITTTGDLIVADVRSTGTAADAIDLTAGALGTNGTARPQLAATAGGIALDAGTDIASAASPLVLSTTTLSAAAGGDAWLELLGDATITSAVLGGGLELTGDGTVTIADLTTGTYADLTAAALTLASADVGTALTTQATTATTLGTVTSSGAQTHTDGAGDVGTVEWTLLDAGGDITIDIGGDVTGADLTGTDTLSVRGAAVDLGTASTTGDQTLTATGALTAATLDTDGRLTASGDSVALDTVTAAESGLEATGNLMVADLTTATSADLAGDTVDLTLADIGTDLAVLGTTSTTLGAIISGGTQTYTDGAGDVGTVEWTMLDADDAISVDIGGDVTGAALSGDDTLAVSGAAVDLGAATTTGNQTLNATGALTATALDTDGRLTASADSVTLDTVTAGVVDLDATGGLTVADLTTATSADLAGDVVDLNQADIGTDLAVLGTTSTTLGTITSSGTQTYIDGAGDTGALEWTTLTAGGDVTVDVGGDVSGTTLTGAENLVVRGAAIAVDTVATAGHQTYRGDALTYDHIDAGTWSGASWGEGEITRVSNIDADVTGTLGGTRARATGRVSLDAEAIDVDTVGADTIAAEANSIDATTLQAATDIELSALTDIVVFDLDAGDDLDLEAGGAWAFETLRTGGDVAARTTGATAGGTAEVGGTAFFRAGYDADGAATTPADLAIDDLAASRARLHTTGTLDVTDPRLARGIEVRADVLTMHGFDRDGGRFDIDVANATGGQLDRIDLEVIGADYVAFDRLYARDGRIAVDTRLAGIGRGWITGELEFGTPAVDLLIKNDEPVLQAGHDVQLYARDERLWLLQAGRLTFTDAWIVRYALGFGGTMRGAGEEGVGAEMYSGISADRLAQGRLDALRRDDGAGGIDDAVRGIADGRLQTGPHPDWRPAVKATFDCTLAFPSGAPGGFPGQWNHGVGGCGDLARLRPVEGRI